MADNKPVYAVKVGQVDCALWENEWEKDGKKGVAQSVSFDCNFFDKKTDEWTKTKTITMNNLPDVILALQKVQEKARVNVKEWTPLVFIVVIRKLLVSLLKLEER